MACTIDRRGIALVLVLWALVVVAALLTIVVFLVSQEQRTGSAGRRLHRTFALAEAGLAEALTDWTPGTLNRQLPRVLDSVTSSGAGWRATIRKLNQGLYLVEVVAADSPPPGMASTATRQRLGRLIRVRPVDVAPPAALSGGGSVALGTGDTIDGMDQASLPGGDCAPSDSAMPGVLAAAIDSTGNPVIAGSPAVMLQPPADSGLRATDLGALAELEAQATVTLGAGTWRTYPSSVGTVCAVSDPGNWGDPSDGRLACGGYMPVVHVDGDLELLPGEGQGILLVDGDLLVHGPYVFSGLVFVRGRLAVAADGPAVKIFGAVLAGSLRPQSALNAVITITYSKCLITKALLSSGRLVPLRSRSWKSLF
jgi:hypothetical protein